jgi:hypothetical protein
MLKNKRENGAVAVRMAKQWILLCEMVAPRALVRARTRSAAGDYRPLGRARHFDWCDERRPEPADIE